MSLHRSLLSSWHVGLARSADTFIMIDRLWYGEIANPNQIYAGEYTIATNTLRILTLVTNALCSAVGTRSTAVGPPVPSQLAPCAALALISHGRRAMLQTGAHIWLLC